MLYNDYLGIHLVKAAGAWCCKTNAIFSEDVEERAAVYLCSTMSTLTFIGLKRPGPGAVQLMPSLVSTLKKEQWYTLALQ
jgi:hypothetical protein